jgi:GNAT superfamily N-acetyltransferase
VNVFSHRLAVTADIPALTALMNASIAALLKPVLAPAQVTASFAIMGLDSQLIADRTYFLVESDGVLAGSGGWSRRATTFGGDHSPGRDTRLLDPATEAARVRAMYTHPDFARRGLGRMVLALCEAAAADAGFARTELVATMGGLPLYRACGYVDGEAFEHEAPSGVRVPLLRMTKVLNASAGMLK